MKILLGYARGSKFYGYSLEWVVSRMKRVLGENVEIVTPSDTSEAGMLSLINDVDVVVGIHFRLTVLLPFPPLIES